MHAVVDRLYYPDPSLTDEKKFAMAQGKLSRYQVQNLDDIDISDPNVIYGVYPTLVRAETICKELNKTSYTYAEAARHAIEVQDACNLSGVSRSFMKSLLAVERQAAIEGKGTDWINWNPIIALFVDKLRHLNQNDGSYSGDVMKAFDECEKIQQEVG